MKVYTVSRPEVDDLAQETEEHANLMTEEHGRDVFLHKARGSDAVQLDTHAGMRVHLQTMALARRSSPTDHARSSGRCSTAMACQR